MSLINSMLRDLEARRSDGAAAAPFQGQVRAVPVGSASAMKFKLAAVAGGVVLLAMAAVAGQRWWQAQAPRERVTLPGPATPAAVRPQEEMANAKPAAVVNAPPATADEVHEDEEAAKAPPASAAGPAQAKPVAPAAPASASAAPAATVAPPPRAAGPGNQPVAVASGRGAMQASAKPQLEPRNEETPLQPAAAAAAAMPAAEPLKIVREAAPQPDAAMQLARQHLQDNALRDAIDTLQRALPQAGGRADYHAFLAALLQRDDQHRAAAEHYATALRAAPDNGVWWMGLGISYQALQMAPQAQQAYRSAQASRGLNPELAAFVEARLAQLQRP